MRSSLLLALALISAAPAALAAEPPLPQPKELLEQQVILPPASPYVVKLDAMRGRILVRGWNHNDVYVHAVRRATHPLVGTEAEYLAATKVALTHPAPGTVAIETQIPGAGDLASVAAERTPHVQVDYELLVPPDCALSIHQENGPVTVVGVNGKVEAFSRDGDVAISDVSGWAEGTNERGNLRFLHITGDAVGKSLRGDLAFRGVTGDVKAATGTGKVRIDVPPQFVGQVGYQTVSGKFRSDLMTFHTDMEAGDKGYRGVLRGPLAGHEPPTLRYTIDTESGDAIVASQRYARY